MSAQQLVPYSFNTAVLPPAQQGNELPPGRFQGVHFTVSTEIDFLLGKIEQWFEDRDEVILVDNGTTAKGLGFIILEWEGYEIDRLFLRILENEETVEDFTVYTRRAEV